MSLLTLTESSGCLSGVAWPSLLDLRLDEPALSRRAAGVGGSDANIILSGDADKIRRLWLEKRGEVQESDLSANLPAMLGCWTEAFNRQWFERLTELNVVSVGRAFQCQRHEWRRCTLDGFIEETEAIWEAKHTNAFASAEEVVERYMPQLQHNMAVVGVERAFLSVIFGNHKFESIEVAADWLYQLDLIEAEADFWECVITGREPCAAPVPAAPKPVGFREVCFEGNNAWATAAFDWLEHRDAAKTHTAASKSLKDLIDADVARAFGHGIEAKRSRSGAVTIREIAK